MANKALRQKQFIKIIELFKKYMNEGGTPNMVYFEPRKCPVCSCDNSSPIMKNTNGIVFQKCNECNMVYVNPILKQEYLEAFYLDSATKTARHTLWEKTTKKYKQSEVPIKSDRYSMLLKHSKGGKFLDFGCGFGKLTDKLKFYFETIEGLEINKYCADFAEKTFKFKVHKDFIQETGFEEEYDACMSYNNIEHLYDPSEVLLHLYKALKANGIIYIECPNINAFSIKVFKGRHHLLESVEHVNMFDIKSLSNILERSGFEVLQSKTRKPDMCLNDIVTYFVRKKDFIHRVCSPVFDNIFYRKLCSFIDTIIIPKLFSIASLFMEGAYIQVVAKKN